MNECRLKVQNALELFACRDGRREQAFIRLSEATRPVLTGYLRLKGLRIDDLEDVVESALIKVWERRDTLSFPDAAHWFGYMKRVVDRLVIDLHRGGRARVDNGHVPLTEVSDERAHKFAEDIADALESSEVGRAADRLWLGDEPPDFRMRLLAAKMLFLDGQNWATVTTIVDRAGSAPPGARGHEGLLEWISDVRVLRSLAFDGLFHSGEELASMLLECPARTLAESMGRLGKVGESGIGRFSGAEVAIVVWKFYCFEPTSQVGRRAEEAGIGPHVATTIERCVARLPFVNVMRQIWDSMGATPARATALTKPGLWKRLVFQYAAKGLPHVDVVSWLGPAAEVAVFKLEPMTVHAWISNRRLQKELATFLSQERPEAALA